MKIALMKGGANITFSANNRSAANADILYALRTINPREHECTIVTHRTRNTLIPKPLQFAEVQTLESLDDFDVVLIFNFSINFFGGAEDPNLMAMYKLWSKTRTPLVYVQTDGQLPFRQVWDSIWKRDWSSNYTEEEVYVDPMNVHYLTQGRDLAKVGTSLKKKPDMIFPRSINHFPWERTILAKHEKFFGQTPLEWTERPYDLIFGGATRNSHKRKLIEKYYNDSHLKNFLFGNLRGVNAPHAKMQSAVSYQEFVRRMNQGKATVIIGDDHYNDNFFTLRMYESLLAGCMVFIDEQLDTQHKFYEGVPHADDLYVRNTKKIQQTMDNGGRELALAVRRQILESYDHAAENSRLFELLRAY